MPGQISPVLITKFVLWIAVVVAATVLLRRRQVTPRLRLAFLIGGVLVFGVGYGLLARGGLNPNPVFSVRNLLMVVLVRRQVVIPVAAMLVILLVMVFVSNKSTCGWGCQLGLFQDLLYRARLPKWKAPFWLSNTVRIVAFVALVAGLAVAGLDWIGLIDPFQLFSFRFTTGVVAFLAVLVVASLFMYRPWCHFLCPFGLLGWLVEQVSLFRPRINRAECKKCQLCVKACPGHAMADFYSGAKVHADCFACGACIDACPFDKALSWSTKA